MRIQDIKNHDKYYELFFQQLMFGSLNSFNIILNFYCTKLILKIIKKSKLVYVYFQKKKKLALNKLKIMPNNISRCE
jgi:hypothetical protein